MNKIPEERLIDEICELLGVDNARMLARELNVTGGTLSHINNKKAGRSVSMGYELARLALRELGPKKRKKIFQELKNDMKSINTNEP